MALPLKYQKEFFFLVFAQVFIIYVNQSNMLFWDTVQFAGKHGSHFFTHGFTQGILLPDAIDSGHPPSFGILMSLVWKIFGKSLVVSHWMMLPFLVGNIYHIMRLSDSLVNRWHYLIPLLFFVCPFYLGQSILVSPDIILVFGFLLALRGIIEKRNGLILIGSIVMALISLRGMALLVPLWLYQIKIDQHFNFKKLIPIGWKKLYPFLPAIALGLSFLIYHYVSKGWIGHHDDSPWAGSFQKMTFIGFFKNVALFLHKLLDFGMLAIIGVILYRARYMPLLKQRLMWLYLFILLLFAILILPYNGLLNHRYFLPLHIVGILICGQLIAAINKKWLGPLVLVIVFTGNFWMYPVQVSQGWDSSFAHQGIYKIESEFRSYIEQQSISKRQISTVFPLKANDNFRHLDASIETNLQDFHESETPYVLYSNVMNDFSDEELEQIQTMKVVKRWNNRGVSLILYKR